MKFTDEEYEKLYKKLEYTFRKSGKDLVKKIENKEDLSEEDLKLLVRKLEYTFRKSEDTLMKKLIELTDEPAVKFSNLKAQKLKKIRSIITSFSQQERYKLQQQL